MTYAVKPLKLVLMMTFLVSPWAFAAQGGSGAGLPRRCAIALSGVGPNGRTYLEDLMRRSAAIMDVRADRVQALSLETYGATQHPNIISILGGRYYQVDVGDGMQVVTRSDELETAVLERAFASGHPVPTVTFRAYRFGQKIDLGRIYSGTGREVSDSLLIESINEFLAAYQQKHDGFQAIEIIFSRLQLDAIGGGNFITHPLGPENMAIAQDISRSLGGPVIITAVTPNGYSYEAAFNGQQNITAQVFTPDE